MNCIKGQTIALRKAMVIVRFWKGWCDNPSVLTAEKFGE